MFLKGREEIGVRITPTSQYGQPYSGIEDYELKERITTELSRRAFYQLSSGKSKRDSSLSSVKKNNRYSFLS